MSGGGQSRALIWLMTWVALVTGFAIASNGYLTQRLGVGSWIHILIVIINSFLIGIALLFIHDRTQTHNPIQRRFPVVYWGRWIAVELGPLLRQYWFASDLEEKPFSRVTREWIYATSKGKKNTIGFGSQVDFDAVGTCTVMPSMFGAGSDAAPYSRTIGKSNGVTNEVEMEHFVNISAMSYGSLSSRAISALNKGASQAGILHNTGEGGYSPYHQNGGSVIWQVGTGKFGCRDENGAFSERLFKEVSDNSKVAMIELKLMQGAKPGKGGILPASKITAEIAAIRNVPIGKDVISPSRHAEFDDVDGLFDFINLLRTTSGKPIGIKLVVGHIEEIEEIAEKMAVEKGRGPDFITVDGGEGGTGAAPLILASHAGVPMKQAIAIVDWAMRKHGVRDDVHLFASGQIATPIDVVVAMALGADGVNIARGFMLSLGCIQALDCNSNRCPTGIATQDKGLEKVLDVEAAAKRVANYVKTLEKEVYMLCHSCGYSSPDQFTSDDIMVVTSPGHLDYLSELQQQSAWEAAQERSNALAAGLTVGESKRLPIIEDA
jgi:glutamate synthase domain-containing protein 2